MRISIWPLLLLPALFSCSPNKEETTTKGHLCVLVSESVAPVLVPEVNEFMRLYKANGADLSCTIVQPEEANRRFVGDTTRMIITTIPLTEEEKDRVKGTTDEFVEIVLAYEGVATIVHEQNPVEEMKLGQIRNILDGTAANWEQLYRNGAPRGKIRVFLADPSDVKGYLSRRLMGGREFRIQPTWTSSSLETVQAVARDRFSIGFVPMSWVDSAKARAKMLSLAADSTLADTVFKPAPESVGKYYSPHPAYVYLNYYPMKRAIYLYARTTRADFPSGFASFLASSTGQKMFLQKGLVPGTQKITLKPSG